jgi:FixJ family two-component response regulator
MSSGTMTGIPAATTATVNHVLGRGLRPAQALSIAPTVFVVDADIVVRESLGALVCSEGWQAEMFASAHEFLERPQVGVPSCLVLDITLPDMTGLELQNRVASERASVPIIFTSGHADVRTTVQAMKAGAIEFLTKPLSHDLLLCAIRTALDISRAALDGETEMRSLRDSYMSLSARERQVMALVVSGLLNKQVAFELGISEITVKEHRGRLMRKMKANSLAELVMMSVKLAPRCPEIRLV